MVCSGVDSVHKGSDKLGIDVGVHGEDWAIPDGLNFNIDQMRSLLCVEFSLPKIRLNVVGRASCMAALFHCALEAKDCVRLFTSPASYGPVGRADCICWA